MNKITINDEYKYDKEYNYLDNVLNYALSYLSLI